MNVMIDPRFAFGRPALRESGITTRAILERWLAGESPADVSAEVLEHPPALRLRGVREVRREKRLT